jgi:hypothetical protein
MGNVKDRVGGGIDGLKNRSGKCEGPGEGGSTVKNRSGKCEGPGGGGGRLGKEPKWEMRKTKAAGGGGGPTVV